MTTTKNNEQFETKERRQFLFNSVSVGLSATAVALLAGSPALAAGSNMEDDQAGIDAQILSVALDAEREAVAAYGVGAASNLLSPGILKVAIQFQGHHKEHADLLINTITQLGGKVSDPKSHNFPVESLHTETDVLNFAATLERGAVSAYAGAIPLFQQRDLAKAAASILADEAMHWAVLRQVLGLDPVPGAFFS